MTAGLHGLGLSAWYGDVPTDRASWLEGWAAWPEREVWAHPAFLDQFRQAGERSVCLVWKGVGVRVLFPLVLRRVAGALGAAQGLWDATGPYGYGGPFVDGVASEGDAASFWSAVAAWAQGQQVVTLFSRLSVFPAQLMPAAPGVEEAGQNVVCDLQRSDEAIWMGYEHKVRKNVNRARREGVTVEVDTSGAELEAFRRIYLGTMDRREASTSFYFEQGWFERLLAQLPEQAILFHARHAGRIISTELVLASRQHLYSFLGGTAAEHFEKRPNDLLKHEIIAWGRRAGRTHFLLGGGFLSGAAGGDDGILKFKRSFAPTGCVPFRVMKWAIDPTTCAQLVEERSADARARGAPWVPRTGYFPPYRS